MNSRVRWYVALVLLFAALAAGGLWWQSSLSQAQLREQVLQQAGQRSQQLADAMAGQVNGVFSSVDLALNHLRHQWRADDPVAFERAVRESLAALPPGFVSHVTVANAEGQVVFNSLGLNLGVNIADRDYFQLHRAGGDRQVIGVPVRSRLNGQWSFALSRPLLGDGRFAGTVQMTLPTDFLAGQLGQLALAEQDVVALIHASGQVLARSKDNLRSMGQSMPANRPYMARPDERKGVYRMPGQVDGVHRTYGWHRLPQSGAVMTIGLADASVLGPLAPALRRSQLLTAALSMLVLVGGALIAVLLWRVARSRAAAVASEARLKDAQRMAHVGNWEHDHRTGQVVWSDEIFRMFGVDPAVHQATYQGFLDVVHPDDRESLVAGFEATVRRREPYDVVHRLLLPDGTLKYVHHLGVAEYDGDQPLRSQGTTQDITDMRMAQSALEAANEGLEDRVQARTRELEALNDELQTFAYSVSHDLRTPLRTINGFASLMEEESEAQSDQGRAHLRRIQEAARRMGQLITDLLTLGQHSRAVMRRERVDLSAMAHEVVDQLQQAQPDAPVQWAIEDGLVAQADPVLMHVVLHNLLGNAWKYSSQTAQPRISFTRTGHVNGMQAFCVRDNGAGFDMAYAAQLFQPFKRLHAHHEFEGSGVGLASVARVIQRHGGQVRGEGAVGRGAAFYFTLPDGAPGLAG